MTVIHNAHFLTVCDYQTPGQFPGHLDIILEVAAIFLPLLKQCAGKLWPPHFQAGKTQLADLYLKLPLY